MSEPGFCACPRRPRDRDRAWRPRGQHGYWRIAAGPVPGWSRPPTANAFWTEA